MSTPFYVSDSFTLTYTNWTSSAQNWHYPGAFNMEKVWGFNQPIQATFDAGEFSFICFSNPTVVTGNNGDVYIGLYDIGSTAGAVPIPNSRLKFVTSTGGAMSEAVLMNSVFRNDSGTALAGGRYVAHAVPIGGVMTPTSSSTYSGSFQLGPNMRFFGAGGVLSYQYFMQGTVDPASSTGGSTGSSATFTLNGLTYTVQST